MPFAARINDDHFCPLTNPPPGSTPHKGGKIMIQPVSKPVLIGGLQAATVGYICICMGPPDSIVKGSSSVLINGKPAARIGDDTAHGGKITEGESSVIIGG
jgi:uncharacterized Zn-binding protein involved in type VI secretion